MLKTVVTVRDKDPHRPADARRLLLFELLWHQFWLVGGSVSNSGALKPKAGENSVCFHSCKALPIPPGDCRQHLFRGALDVGYLAKVLSNRLRSDVAPPGENLIHAAVQLPASDDHSVAPHDHPQPALARC